MTIFFLIATLFKIEMRAKEKNKEYKRDCGSTTNSFI